MLNEIISIVLFGVLVGLSSKLQNLRIFLIACVLLIISFSLIVYAIKWNYKPFMLPVTLVVIFQPLRIICKKINKREPILYFRGIQLSHQEIEPNVGDYIYSFLLLFIPILTSIVFFN
jgi:hypothetical protein